MTETVTLKRKWNRGQERVKKLTPQKESKCVDCAHEESRERYSTVGSDRSAADAAENSRCGEVGRGRALRTFYLGFGGAAGFALVLRADCSGGRQCRARAHRSATVD